MTLGLDMDDGEAVSVRRMLLGACAVLVLIAACLGTAAPSQAAGKPGTAYVLDIARGKDSGGKIFKLNSVTGDPLEQATVPAPWGPGIPEFRGFFNPVGIKVDAQGYLIVAVSDGYNSRLTYPGTSFTDPCDSGCGAVLRINPDNGRAVVLTRGPFMSNPYAVLLPPDNDITDNDKNNYLLVADNGESQIIKVNLNSGLGRNINSNQKVAYASNGGNLFKPWGISRNGSQVVVANTGNPQFQARGHLSRFTDSGGNLRFKGRVNSSEFRHPRGLTIALGESYVSDPFVPPSGSGGYGLIFGVSGFRTDFVSAFNLLQTPSGMALDYRGKYLLVADENGNQPGKVVRINPDGGAQKIFATNLGSSAIDIAVDRRRAPKPPAKPKNRIRPLASFERDRRATLEKGNVAGPSGFGIGINIFRLYPVTRGASMRLVCLTRGCVASVGRRVITQRVRGSSHSFHFRTAVTNQYLSGRFRIIEFVRGKRNGYRFASVYREYVYLPGNAARPRGLTKESTRLRCLKPGRVSVSSRSKIRCPS